MGNFNNLVFSFSVALNTRRDDVMCRTLKVFPKEYDVGGGDVDGSIQLTHEHDHDSTNQKLFV